MAARGVAFAANGIDAWSETESLVMTNRHLVGGSAKVFGRCALRGNNVSRGGDTASLS